MFRLGRWISPLPIMALIPRLGLIVIRLIVKRSCRRLGPRCNRSARPLWRRSSDVLRFPASVCTCPREALRRLEHARHDLAVTAAGCAGLAAGP